jgi:hypothetical protein
MIEKWKSAWRLIFCASLAAVVVLTGCSTFGGGSRGDTFMDSSFNPDQKAAEDRLHEIVREYIATEQANAEKRNAPVVKRRPYYFREYSVYPDGAEGFSIDFREVDSRIRPMLAEVRVSKIRYSTQMHRNKGRAENDMNFMRDTGVETLVFELRSGRWSRTGKIFDAQKTEEQINGEWFPRREETERVVPSEDRPGFFKRIWMRIRGEKE